MGENNQLIYDWNTSQGSALTMRGRALLDDETLRDGLQSPSVLDPPIEKKIQILHLMEELGIDSVNLGLPGAGPRAKLDVLRLAQEIASRKMRIRPKCAARAGETGAVARTAAGRGGRARAGGRGGSDVGAGAAPSAAPRACCIRAAPSPGSAPSGSPPPPRLPPRGSG